MKHLLFVLSAVAVAGTVSAALPQNGSGETDGYTLVWQELFDAPDINPERWEIEVNGDGGGNSELQYYTDREENVRIGVDADGNSCLILTARREEYANRHFTSGRIISKNRTYFTHGKIEASIKLPATSNGLWPAFWMMGNDFDQVGWPACGETDIMEMGHQDAYTRGTQDRFFNGAMHWGARWDMHGQYANSETWSYSLQDDDFHLYTVLWDDEVVEMYVDYDRFPDAKPYFRMTIPVVEPDNVWHPGNYFHKPNFILFNLAVGGNFPGIWDASKITALNSDNGNSASMFINYVRVYQKGSDSETFFSYTPGDQSSVGPEIAVPDSRIAIRFEPDTILTSAPACISVTDMRGAVVASTPQADRLSTADLAAGLYIVSATAHDGSSTIAKLKI